MTAKASKQSYKTIRGRMGMVNFVPVDEEKKDLRVKTMRILSGEEKSRMSNFLYEYGRADTDERRKYVRTLLFSYIEKLLNEEV